MRQYVSQRFGFYSHPGWFECDTCRRCPESSSCLSMLMGEMVMNEIALLGGSFVFVFALSYQQQNIFYRRYFPAVVNAAFIASLNLLVVKMGSQATPAEMLAFIAGQPLGTVAAMWLSSRRLASQAQETQSSALERRMS